MISPPQLSLRGLRTFCAAARSESFSTAAEELFITASADDEHVVNLRDWIVRYFADPPR